VTTFYGYDLAPAIAWGKGDWRRHRQELFEEGDLFLVEGPFMRKTMITLGCPAEKVQIQRIALPLDELPFRVRKPRLGGKVRILFAGRFTEKKGLIYALRAVGELWKERKDFEFRIIGAGELAEEFKRFIQENELDDCVKLLGLMNYQEYLGEMAQASIFLHPSVVASNGDTEGGAPTVILEAQAMGMPVVSTLHADIPYVTVPGKSAILVQERDVTGLNAALSHLLNHPEAWEEMGRAGRAHIESYHNIVHEVSALEDKYFRLLSRNSSQESS
jgi:colanic acid/amylovoran biosynthesis glycosyltransferase